MQGFQDRGTYAWSCLCVKGYFLLSLGAAQESCMQLLRSKFPAHLYSLGVQLGLSTVILLVTRSQGRASMSLLRISRLCCCWCKQPGRVEKNFLLPQGCLLTVAPVSRHTWCLTAPCPACWDCPCGACQTHCPAASHGSEWYHREAPLTLVGALCPDWIFVKRASMGEGHKESLQTQSQVLEQLTHEHTCVCMQHTHTPSL